MSEWINVKDKLPFHGEYTLTYHKDSEPCIRIHEFSWKAQQWNKNRGGKITHWMSLPRVPNES